MLKKRLIFTLLFDNGQFVLSRNFRLQNVGNFSWLKTNYNFSQISSSIDELIVLDVTRGKKNLIEFCSTLERLTDGCFVPIAAGGGITSVEDARRLLRSGADKIVVNSALYQSSKIISELASEFGEQCIVASIDIKSGSDGIYRAWSDCGGRQVSGSAAFWVSRIMHDRVGELYLNSMDQDGTGQGYDLRLLDLLPIDNTKPVILAGGVGNANHLSAGLKDARVDAVATAHLFNFVGDGLRKARNTLISMGHELPLWDLEPLKDSLNSGTWDEV